MDQASLRRKRSRTVFLCESPLEKGLSFFADWESIEFISRLISFGVSQGTVAPSGFIVDERDAPRG